MTPMDQYPPGEYVSRALQTLPAAGPDQPLKTVDIDCGPLWGAFRITFIAKRNPRQGMRNWFWMMHKGERIDFSPPASSGGVVDFVVVHEANVGTAAEPGVSSDRAKPQAGSDMTITDLIAAVERIKAEHGNLTVAEELPIGFIAIRDVEVRQIPQYRAFRTVPSVRTTVADGELVVIIKAQ